MFDQPQTHHGLLSTFRRWISLSMLLLIGWTQGLWAIEPRPRSWDFLESLHLDTTHRRSLAASVAGEWLRLDVPEVGMLSVEVTTPSSLRPALALDLRPLAPGWRLKSQRMPAFREVERTRTRWIVQILEPGPMRVAVTSLRPADEPIPYKLRTAFVEPSVSSDSGSAAPQDPPDSCSDGEPPRLVLKDGDTSSDDSGDDTIDPWDCDVWSGLMSQGGVLEMTATGAPVEARVFGGTDCVDLQKLGRLTTPSDSIVLPVHRGEYRFAIDSLLGSDGPYSIRYRLYPLCARGEQDDHGDSAACATPLEGARVAAGILENPERDDEDYFVGRLAKAGQFTVEVESEREILCQVLGERDQVLVGWQRCGGDHRPSVIRGFGEGRLTVAVAMLDEQPSAYSVRVIPGR